MNNDLKKSAVKAMDGDNIELFEHIPFLLQDLEELGSSSVHVLELLKSSRILEGCDSPKILDLGCGKGLISVQLAKQFKANVTGIDAFPEFIKYAEYKAKQDGVQENCQFVLGDMRELIKTESGYDLIVLGSIGPVLGNIKETLDVLEKCLKINGYIFLDDAYIPDSDLEQFENYLPEKEFFKFIDESNYEIIYKSFYEESEMIESDILIFNSIEIRAKELMAEYPEQKKLFEEYLIKQEIENEILENHAKNISLLLRLKPVGEL